MLVSIKNRKKLVPVCLRFHPIIFSGFIFIWIIFLSTNTKAQKSSGSSGKSISSAETAELIQQIKVLLPYRKVKLKIDQSNLPITLTINPKNYDGLYSYSAYLKQTFDSGEFDNFSETCINHIASRKIRNPNDSSFFKANPDSKPVIID